MINFGKLLEKRYEKEIGEPWADLEARVRGRHKDLFAQFDSIKELESRLERPTHKPRRR